jgi:hypothetical protein
MRAKTLDEIEETLDTHHNALARRQMEGDDPGLLLHWRQAIETAGLLLESCRSIAGEVAQYREACDLLAGRLDTTEADRDQARADALVHLTESQRLAGRVGAYHRIVNNLVQLRQAQRCRHRPVTVSGRTCAWPPWRSARSATVTTSAPRPASWT